MAFNSTRLIQSKTKFPLSHSFSLFNLSLFSFQLILQIKTCKVMVSVNLFYNYKAKTSTSFSEIKFNSIEQVKKQTNKVLGVILD